MDGGLDAVDQRIVAELTRDGRLSISAVAGRVNVSRANAYNRVERLKGRGVITGYTALVDPLRVGLTTSAYVALTVRQNSWRQLSQQLRRIQEVKHMALVGGDVDVMLLVRTADNDALRSLVLDQLQAMPGVLSTRTLLIFEDLDNRQVTGPADGGGGLPAA